MFGIEVSTQAEFDAAIKRGDRAICVSGRFQLTTRGREAPRIEVRAGVALHVVARGSSTPHVEAWGSSSPHVVARGSSSPHVVAWESSAPHVVAWESSTPHVEAWGSSAPHVEAWESSTPHVEASAYVQLVLRGNLVAKLGAMVSAVIHGRKPKVEGGRQTHVVIETPAQWCDYYGVTVEDGVATLYKAVDDDYSTSRARAAGIYYRPDSVPVAPDWDGGVRECGGGLHFSPRPEMAIEFNGAAKRFVACPVALSDISVHWDGECPQKVKARACCAPVWEVDRKGARVEQKERADAAPKRAAEPVALKAAG